MRVCGLNFLYFRFEFKMSKTFERLTDENLAQNMENVLEIVCKIGKG